MAIDILPFQGPCMEFLSANSLGLARRKPVCLDQSKLEMVWALYGSFH